MAGEAGGGVIARSGPETETETGRVSSLAMYPAGPIGAGRTVPSRVRPLGAWFFLSSCLPLTSYQAPTHTNAQAHNTPQPVPTSLTNSPPYTHVRTLAPTQTQHRRTHGHSRLGPQTSLTAGCASEAAAAGFACAGAGTRPPSAQGAFGGTNPTPSVHRRNAEPRMVSYLLMTPGLVRGTWEVTLRPPSAAFSPAKGQPRPSLCCWLLQAGLRSALETEAGGARGSP